MTRHSLRAVLPTAALAALLAAPVPALAGEDETPAAPIVPAAEAKSEDLAATLQAELEAWIEENQEGLTYEIYSAKIAELLADVDIESLDAYQLDELKQMIMASPEHRDRAIARATELAKGDDARAAVATIMLVEAVRFEMPDPQEFATPDEMRAAMQRKQSEAIVNALKHPGLQEALREGHGGDVFGMISGADPEVLAENIDEVIAVTMLINGDLPPEVLGRTANLPMALNEMGDAITPEQREEIRVRIVDAMREAMPKAREKDEELAKYLERGMQFLDGAYARGELLDHVSPAVAFTWCSDEPALASVADLEGKVVVLDFWATWCGPCIASFPNVRELQKHYDGYDVAIVGVTSLQGKHYPGDGPPVDTEGDADKEHELMKEFIASKDMTWTVAFSEADVFNPDYGVRGIPHLAILDAEGKVRYNGLHPSSPLSEKTAKIDALLKEAGLPAPPSPGDAASDSDEHAGHDHDGDSGHADDEDEDHDED